jgi:hypothetical protein
MTTLKDAREVCREKFANWPRVLVIHVNSFTRKVEGGYWLRHGVKSDTNLTRSEACYYLTTEPETPVEFLSV